MKHLLPYLSRLSGAIAVFAVTEFSNAQITVAVIGVLLAPGQDADLKLDLFERMTHRRAVEAVV
jgi:hypothetical protein